MKHRWTGGLLLAAALSLAACTPTDAGADEESTSPSVEADAAPSAEEASPTPAPTMAEPDEY